MTRISRFFTLLVLLIYSVGGAEAAEPNTVVLLGGAGVPWREARQIIERHGGRVTIAVPPDVIVGEIPEAAVTALQQASMRAASAGAATAAPPGFRAVRTRGEAEALLGSVNVAQAPDSAANALTSEAKAALRLLAPELVPPDRDPRFRVLPGGIVEERPIRDWEDPPLLPPVTAADSQPIANAIGNTFNNTSGFLAGDVGIGILRPESTGSSSGDGIDTEIWTDVEVTNSLAQVMSSLDKLASDSPRGKITFVVRTETFGDGVAGTVACDYEAILTANWTSAVVLNFLGKLGYTQASYFSRLREWDNDIRSDLGTDWAFGVIIVDNSTDTTRGRASAYLNGPAEWLFQSSPATTYHHESGHIWGAADEYHPDATQSPTAMWGYTQVPNANSQYNSGTGYFSGAGEGIPALQINNIDYVSPWGRGAWGIWDRDGDGINDTQDTVPTVSLNPPSGTAALTYTGVASATALKRESGTLLDADVTINRIVAVEWRINGGPWQDSTANDGSFNASSEAFTFTTPVLRNGPYVVEARARDNFGNATANYPRRTDTVSGSGASNNAPMAALAVAPLLGSTATSFALSAAGSLDAEDSANLQYRWDYDNDGTFDTAYSQNPAATQSYGTAGVKTARVEVKDPGGAVAVRSVTFSVAAADVPPTAEFIVDHGSLFAASPAVFNFDASRVVDGEDAASAVLVRWDFDDDGNWDTGFSTAKTISHDYAQVLAIAVSNETGSSYLYSGNTINAFAQSFTATSAGIGQAALYLRHNNDNTAGGTCTAGIRSAISGAFLTSVTQNQASLKDSAWNVFEFPDIAVTIGNVYYLVFICSDADMMWRANNANPYAGGQHYFSSSGGAIWSSNSTYDHYFRIYDNVMTTVPLTKSYAWRVRMEAKDSSGQTAQTVRDIWTNAYDTSPAVSLGSAPLSGTTATTFNLTATAGDADFDTVWDGLLHYRWDVDGDGHFETEFAAANTRAAVISQPGIYQAAVEVRDRYYATARASVQITVAPVTGAKQMTLQAGDSQTAAINQTVSTPPAVVVRDASNNPVAGVVVVYSVLSGGGIIAGASQVTNGSGIATLGSWTMGPSPGTNGLAVKMPNYPLPAALTFNATAVSGGAPTLTSINPSSGATGASVGVTLEGIDFALGETSVTVSGTGVTADNVNVVSGASLTATLTIASGATPGTRNITVTTPGGTSNASTFTVVAPKKRTGQLTSQ